ncbi:HYC_CC_PP family protein [Persicitalea jodogahamensis]|uniref:Uncharacterized protein n=1 Tax=Persicitalea jodogahamensis TaxID=402147 RepID=A0A8J3D5Y0_9BACT|nr:hypothetical protein [Persicitalea jodogahamensis]GHB78543.1 hypothetical protein GCM10007390_36060 [Persicitalea jodogahamensis]
MIKSKPYRFFAIFMAILVLISSTGFGLVEHSCMVRGKSVELAALKKEDASCQACKPAVASETRTNPPLQFKKKACCEENHKYQKLEALSASSPTVKLIKVLPFTPAITKSRSINFASYAVDLLGVRGVLSAFPSFSSKFYGRTMLSFVQSYLI